LPDICQQLCISSLLDLSTLTINSVDCG
jgi:hypothetical protein